MKQTHPAEDDGANAKAENKAATKLEAHPLNLTLPLHG